MNFYMKTVKLLILFLIIIQSSFGQAKKINGVSFVASRDTINELHISPVINVNANYVAVMPFGFIKDLKHPEIAFNTERQWFGETKVGAKQYIQKFQEKGVKIAIKPQIWVWRGEYTGFIEMDNEDNWNMLENSYTKFILIYATLAQEINAELFCIGTELEKFIEKRPQYWSSLIKKIRKVYKGKLTYAANWDEFKHTPFWSDLDYIGVDAYFPVSIEKTPTVKQCMQGWEQHKKVIKGISDKFNKPILFTEFGYRSVDYTGKEPWKSDRNMTSVNLEAQTNATKAVFEMFWKEDWFAGGFIWKWFHKHDKVGGHDNSQFTPQNKPVEKVVRETYLKY